MNFDHPTAGQLPLLRSLWKEAFGDTEEYLDDFFSTAYSPRRCRCAFLQGQLAGMLFWLDVTCRNEKMAYLYGVATVPEFRGRGVCRGLLADAHGLLKDRGYAGALLVPQEEGLRQMYEKLGFASFSGIQELFCAAGPAPAELHRITTGEFARLRRQLLPEEGVLQEGESLALLETQLRFYRGADFLLAAQVTPEGALYAPELLGNAEAAPGILRALGCPQGTFRTPGERLKYAMFRPLQPGVRAPGYLGFCYD